MYIIKLMEIRYIPNNNNSSLAMADHAKGESRPVMEVDPKFLLASVFGLLIIVAIVVILHLYTRYVLRRHARRLIMERQLEGRLDTVPVHAVARPAPPKRGLDVSIIAALPIFAYRSGGPGALECSVCLSRMEEEMVRMMPNCKHVFHADCIDKWLHSHTTCPVCRAEVAPPRSTAPEGRLGGSSSGTSLGASGRILSRDGHACGRHEASSHDLEGQ